MSVEYAALFHSLLGLDDTAECKSTGGDGFRRPIGPEKHIVAEAMSAYLDEEITNKEFKFKHALSHFCSEEEKIDLDIWFPDEEEKNNEEKEIAHDGELQVQATKKERRKLYNIQYIRPCNSQEDDDYASQDSDNESDDDDNELVRAPKSTRAERAVKRTKMN